MFSKSQIKFIKSLSLKKNRYQNGMFVAEGRKGVEELLKSGYKVHSLYTTDEPIPGSEGNFYRIGENDLKKLSNLNTPQDVLAVFEIPESVKPTYNGLLVGLDQVQDPGNLGTIIRLCDWFGVEHLVCSQGTVDCYNPKVVQATMGSLARVQVYYTSLEDFLANRPEDFPVFGAFLEGAKVYETDLPEAGILVMGNEANGISPAIEKLIPQKLHIPRFGADGAESLNVATATAVLLSEFRRRSLIGR